MGQTKKRILFIYKDFSQFVRKDYEVLDAEFDLIPIHSPFGKSPRAFISAGVRQFFRLLRHFRKADMMYCWFADYHSFLPALFCKWSHKRFYLVLGGYDVAHIKSLDYGSFNKKPRAFCTRYSLRAATLNLPVAAALGREAVKRAGKINLRVFPTGYDPGQYPPGRVKRDIILTVSITDSWQRFMVKGLDRFVELARRIPQMEFVLIGLSPRAESLIEDPPVNLKILDRVDHEELSAWYGQSRFYAQLSRSEGLPNALCEAMLGGCIPLGIRIGGIPEAIGDTGILLDEWDAGQMAEAIRQMDQLELRASAARDQIIRNFPQDKRREGLISLLK